jgi:1-acyl-sn-glycerol-3-phosphate acyltransferase
MIQPMAYARQPSHPFRPGEFAFHPPRIARWLLPLARLYCPLLLKYKLGVAQVELPAADRARLERLGRARAVLAPNHPGHEPEIVFHLSTLLGQEYNFLAAKEVFIHSWLQGFVVSRIGCYSIVRGANDRESFKATRELIAQGARWLVMFPEGQDHYHTDMLTPFQPGVVQLCLWGLDKLAAGLPAGAPLPPVWLVPMFIRYHFLREMRPAIDASLARLERALKLPVHPPGLDCYGRLGEAGLKLLALNEERYNVRPPAGAAMGERLNALRELLITRVATSLGVKVPRADQPLRDRLRDLFNALDHVAEEPGDASAYSRELAREQEGLMAGLYRELDRVLGFVSVSDDYVLVRPAQERFCDVLGRLEREVLGRERYFGPQRAVVRVGEAINLSEHYVRYQADKRGVVQELTLELEGRVRALLEETAGLLTPLPPAEAAQ